MSRRDYRSRETKKPKKVGKKPDISILTPPPSVEVIKKKRKPETEGD